jgi:hypothetical protein
MSLRTSDIGSGGANSEAHLMIIGCVAAGFDDVAEVAAVGGVVEDVDASLAHAPISGGPTG